MDFVCGGDHARPCECPGSAADLAAIRRTYDLAEIIPSVKSFSVHQINRLRGSRGSLWQDERYNRIIRDKVEFLEKWRYIINNPVMQELAHRWEGYPWLYIKND